MKFVIARDSKFLEYDVGFHHIHKAHRLGAQKLGKVTGLRGLTVAFVRQGNLTSIAVALCSQNDVFSREAGRQAALEQALRRCKPFHKDIPQILDAYANRPREAAGKARAAE